MEIELINYEDVQQPKNIIKEIEIWKLQWDNRAKLKEKVRKQHRFYLINYI